ncbi:two pore channel protein 1 [Lepeophtheirus salmonis]|uniref:two pore channel protein 1 n=1 Tax=Lepeophtheirus salmonis TaxID=72036 RepID=UPI001AE580E0|nr:two pore calcium channel protein 1-like [Lepeophtheirus salmonis]
MDEPIEDNKSHHSLQLNETSKDVPNIVGNTSGVSSRTFAYREMPDYEVANSHWDSNYREASIFLEEGLNNEKFNHHPCSSEALPAYLLVHNVVFNVIDLCASIVLLGLAFFEDPCLPSVKFPPIIHAGIELCSLVLVAVQVLLKTRWIGWKDFFRHKRTAFKIGTLFVMVIETLTVMVRNQTHFRVTRALRPIFIIDNHYCWGVRRFIRQILQSLPPIFDMMGLIVFVMIIYSVFGFYLFSDWDPDNFQTFVQSFVSLFVLLTTANYPDVMMKSYHKSFWSSTFFISYLSINLYILMNLMLAVVYDTFTKIEKDKFRKLYLHKRKAAQHAFKLLVTRERKNVISFNHFRGLITFYKPSASDTEAFLIFKFLNKSQLKFITLDEFYNVYDACVYKWRPAKSDEPWYNDSISGCTKKIFELINKIVTSAWFDHSISFVVLINGIILLVQAGVMASAVEDQYIYVTWISYFFIGLYTAEATFKLLGLGLNKYFSDSWNTFDFITTVLGILSLIFEYLGTPIFFIVILRPLRLLSLFRIKQRFRDVFGTTVILYPRMVSAVIVIILIYYFFAIIGMECFHGLPLKNCCKNTSVEQFYKFEEGSSSNLYFYLNNFNDLASSGVTLFELTVVNNWFVIMEGFAHVKNESSRLFFMVFYLFTMIVMTIIVAFILEAFLFRIQYKECLTKEDEIKKLMTEVVISSDEVNDYIRKGQSSNQTPVLPNAVFRFNGYKSRTKTQLQQLMYANEMDGWIAEAQSEESNIIARALNSSNRGRCESSEDNGDAIFFHQNQNSGGASVHIVDDEEGEVSTINRRIISDDTS